MKKFFNTKNIIIAVLGILLLVGPVGKWLGWDNDGEEVKTEVRTNTVVKTDTIRVVTEKVIIKEPIVTNMTRTVQVPYKLPRRRIDSLDVEKPEDSIFVQIPVNEYQDTIDVDGATLAYHHEVAGYLEASNYAITYPEKTITVTDSVFTTITTTKNRIYDFFLVGGYQVKPHAEYKIGVDFVTKKWKIGATTGYDPMLNQQTVSVNVGIRLFGR